MYTVVMGTGPDRERALTKARAIAALPRSPDDLSVVVVRAEEETGDTDEPTASVITFFENHDIVADVVTTRTAPSNALLDVASDHGADLLCVGGRQRSPAGKMQLRRGAQSVILNAERPVLVTGGPDDHN